MEYLPLFINLKNKPVLVVGGGGVAVRKIEILRRTGAIIRIVARSLCVELTNMLSEPKIYWVSKDFEPMMLSTVVLVIAATNNVDLNNLIYQSAEKFRVLINTVDDQNKCSCIFPAIIDRSPVLIGITSSGTAPMLIRVLREKLEFLLPISLGLVAKLAGLWRERVKKCIKNVIYRRRFWEKIFYNEKISTLMEQGLEKEADQILKNTLSMGCFYHEKGSVSLVGAGPGDSGLLTMQGLKKIQQADIILYDYLIGPDILELARRDASKICVGKRAGTHLISQKEINNFLVQSAQLGNRVVRLKGGDPFIFGRGGEELQAISEAGILFQIVPGITSGIGSAAYAGIPLTHRKYAHSVTFITGHCVHNVHNWSILSDDQQTLVVYMGKKNAEKISENLILHGRNMQTPVAIISNGTCQRQKIIIGTLMELGNLIYFATGPTLLIIGNVVSLRKKYIDLDT